MASRLPSQLAILGGLVVTTAVCASLPSSSDALEEARRLHGAGRSEDAARILRDERPEDLGESDEAAWEELESEIDPTARALRETRIAAAQRIAALARGDREAGWVVTASEMLALVERLHAPTARTLRIEWGEASADGPSSSGAWETWFDDADHRPSDLPWTIGPELLEARSTSDSWRYLFGRRLPERYEVSFELRASKRPAGFIFFAHHVWMSEHKSLIVELYKTGTSLGVWEMKDSKTIRTRRHIKQGAGGKVADWISIGARREGSKLSLLHAGKVLQEVPLSEDAGSGRLVFGIDSDFPNVDFELRNLVVRDLASEEKR